MTALDGVVRELAEVALELDRLPSEDSRRPNLEERRRELKDEAARLSGGTLVAELRRELATLEAQREQLEGRHVDMSGGGFLGGDAGFSSDAQRLNRRIDEAAGREALEARITELHSRLERLKARNAGE